MLDMSQGEMGAVRTTGAHERHGQHTGRMRGVLWGCARYVLHIRHVRHAGRHEIFVSHRLCAKIRAAYALNWDMCGHGRLCRHNGVEDECLPSDLYGSRAGMAVVMLIIGVFLHLVFLTFHFSKESIPMKKRHPWP